MKEKVKKFMERVLILRPYLKLLSDGRIFKLSLSWFLRILTGLLVIAFFAEWIGKWQYIFKMNGSMVLLLAIIMFLALAVLFGIVNVILVKADAIGALPESDDYIVIPIAVVFIKMTGEIFLFVFAFIGIAGFLLALTDSGAMILRALPFFGRTGFINGLTGLVFAFIAGFISFFISYFIAEQVGVFADIAKNTKK